MVGEDRFWAKVEKHSGGCWLWLGARDSHGYGRVRHFGATRLAHRVAWELTRGTPPVGMSLCHACDTPPCVNPEHLFLGTQADNIWDAAAKGRLVFGVANITKTHCPNGHPYDERVDANGKRKCSYCMNARKRAKRNNVDTESKT
jgi:hypothetical protein